MANIADRRFELITSLDEYASRFEAAVREAIAEFPTVTAYFVAADHDSVEVQMGLRFEGMDPKYIEESAEEILQSAIDGLSHDDAGQPVPVREESSLVPA